MTSKSASSRSRRTARPRILGQHDGFVKIVADEKYGEILGVHIIGPEAFELISEGVLAMEAEATVETLTAHHPRASDDLRSRGRGVQRSLRTWRSMPEDWQ